ncbi:FAD-binding oxidoreductase [Aquihabitans sp. G128]|uniref:FAD-binding oxidoreductase n=1 Tax=Aquihabitans sp. G128 TaxID=2849779 RepID=UPI0020B3889C|nr:FAD-binding oxidoreductase [Aquihabitans sp. G128]
MPDPTEPLAGWANTAPTPATVLRPQDVDELAAALDRPSPRGVVARGLGRSYGDPAQNAGGLVALTTGVSGIHHLDLEAGLVTAEAGTSIDALIRWLVPLGWFVPVTPGTRQVTVGGAIASDVHGKNHHKVGSWCDAVEALTIVTPAGGRQQITPASHPDLFWATAGGMGLTGIILDATIRLTRVRTSLLSVDTDRTPDLDTTLDLMESGDHAYDYSVAWIDLMARGAAVGRSILDRGRFADPEQLSDRQRRDPLGFRSGSLATFPDLAPTSLITRTTVRAFNEVWYRKAPRRRRDHLQTISQFFHPLDMVDRWNRVYGPRGLLQWQCAVPPDATDDLRWIVQQISASGQPSFLAVLKRFGPGNAGPLSFPVEGWTLALDVPAGADPDLGQLLDRLDDRVVAAGGRLYLAKDSRLRPELLEAMYPRLDEWRKARDAADPDGRLASDLGRRLGLIG